MRNLPATIVASIVVIYTKTKPYNWLQYSIAFPISHPNYDIKHGAVRRTKLSEPKQRAKTPQVRNQEISKGERQHTRS